MRLFCFLIVCVFPFSVAAMANSQDESVYNILKKVDELEKIEQILLSNVDDQNSMDKERLAAMVAVTSKIESMAYEEIPSLKAVLKNENINVWLKFLKDQPSSAQRCMSLMTEYALVVEEINSAESSSSAHDQDYFPKESDDNLKTDMNRAKKIFSLLHSIPADLSFDKACLPIVAKLKARYDFIENPMPNTLRRPLGFAYGMCARSQNAHYIEVFQEFKPAIFEQFGEISRSVGEVWGLSDSLKSSTHFPTGFLEKIRELGNSQSSSH